MTRIRPGFLLVVIAISCRPAAPRFQPIPPNWKEPQVDVCAGLDGITLDPNKPDEREAFRGRMLWNLWIGDNAFMWDELARKGFGTADLLKTIDSRRHDTRFQEIGIINQPGFVQAARPDIYGLYIDVPDPSDPAGKIDQQIDFTTYGRSSGVVGLRIRDNPAFDEKAKAEWMDEIRKTGGYAKRFYEDPAYYNDPKLVRPYIVGMSCGLCHVSFDPVRPPVDVNRPRWENLCDYIGAQYFNVAEFFVPRRVKEGKIQDPEEESFIWQLLHSNPRGALDTSFIATDYLNNPGTMNGIFNVRQRLRRAATGVSKDPGKYDSMTEWLTGGALDLKWVRPDHGQLVPRVIKQGDDSVGFEGALSRVFLNIGNAWPEMRRHFRPLVGGPLPGNPRFASQSPVRVRDLQMSSASWNWSEERAHALAVYFIQYAKPRLLKDAPGGGQYLTTNPNVLNRGKIVFAENCAGCHSSKQPLFDPFTPHGTSEAAKAWFRAEVMKPDFTDNFLSDERRHPVTQIRTNSTRAAATNATRGHIWDNFSSETYKKLPPIGAFEVDNPYSPTGKSTISIPLPGEGNGPGYYRPPSLISLWSSAPFLHNNAVGIDPLALTPNDVSVAARMKAFQDAIEKMLWIQPRGNVIWKTTKRSFIRIPLSYLEKRVQDAIRRHPELIDASTDTLVVGPIPKGTPINLIANTNLEAGVDLAKKRIALFDALIDTLTRIRAGNFDDAAAMQLMQKDVVPRFLDLNKCPDFYEDKGHEFGKNLPLADKRALIELLKTF